MATHKIVHIEIPATSGKESAEFYGTLFDWPVDVDPNFDYWMFNPAEGPVGGFSMMTEGGPMPTKPGDVLVYVTTDDIEATLARAESLGGKALVHTTELPGTGWYGVFADPTGNRIGVYKSMRTANTGSRQ